ncbi:hexose transporter-like protein [Phaeosphaeriaceae sp. PMI808]|nr:hexose transporter-like protein [Phaeosphaeriaceae sp. PMI808]
MPPAVILVDQSIIERLVANDHVKWWNKPNLRRLYLSLVPFCIFIESTSGFDNSLMNGLQALKYWVSYMDNPSPAMLGFLTSSYAIGAITAVPFVSLVTDHLGRRMSIVFGSCIMIIGAIIQGLAQNVGMFAFARCVLGHGIVYAIVSGSALLGELGHPKERPFLGSMFNAFYGVGAVLGAGIVLRTIEIQNDWSWRLPSILQALPSVIQIVFAWTVPESPRWLVSKDRSEEALEVLIKYHGEGDASQELPHLELAEIRKALEIENASRARGWGELFQTKGMRHRAAVACGLGLFTQFSGNTLISQYLVQILKKIGITNGHIQVRFNIGMESWGLLTALIIAVVAPRYPRRRMYMLTAILLLLIYSGWTAAQARYKMSPSSGTGIAVLVLIFLYKPAYAIGYNALTYVYLVELWPYYVRTKGISFFQLFGRLANMFGSQVNPIGLAELDWKYLIVYVAWLCIEVVFIWFLFPETYGKTLEELTFLFESEQQGANELAAATAKIVEDPHIMEVRETAEKQA